MSLTVATATPTRLVPVEVAAKSRGAFASDTINDPAAAKRMKCCNGYHQEENATAYKHSTVVHVSLLVWLPYL